MVRLVGLNLPDNAPVNYALTLINGVGFTRSTQILKSTQIDGHKKVREITEDDVKKIQEYIEKNFKVEGDLRSEISENIKRLKEIGAYRGIRHMRGLPARGQRTKTNARTRKGKRRTVGALSKEAWAKVDQVQTQNAKK